MSSRHARRISTRLPYLGKLTLSAGVITDVTRLAGVEGDGATYPASRAGVWPAATNLCTNGGFETNTTGWANNGSASIARTTLYSKFGNGALLVTLGNSGSTDGANFGGLSGASLTLTNGTVYTASAWVRAVTGTLALRIRAIDSTPDVLATGTITATTTPQLVSVTFTATADNDHTIQILNNTGSASSAQFVVDGVSIYASSISLPYIETDGGTASRVAGRIQMPASVLDETQMWIAGRLRAGQAYNAGSGAIRVWQWQDSGTERLILQYVLGDKFYWDRDTGAGGAYVSSTLNFASGDHISFAAYATASALGVSINGATFTTGANTAVPTLAASLADIASNEGGSQWNGDVAWFAAGKGTLTNADAALFNSWGNNDPLPHQFPRSAQLTFLARFNGDGTAYRYSA